ncbi:hypothetical protein HYH03_002773 [Edaphochlamys debaryana]|uniref:Uncharacterized protein n=1 Tax=Edaphochlamys debaryana TaxID=47281 RepID=A0A835YCR3_9CHLO|nr:hypothetical protein HYH03_002773 [Edaphochlamys debaryana]|eukprot:KAG2499192.1 hypothetical protein HYH03_002773 [Edaphochlamys debaryana]
MTDDCNSFPTTTGKYCGWLYRWEWFGVWFTFLLVLIILLAELFGKASSWASTLQAFCAACLSVTMLNTNAYVENGSNGYEADDAALAGFLIASMGLFLLIICLGLGGAGVVVNVAVQRTSKSSPEAKSEATKVETA